MVSFPHFYNADPKYINAIDGLSPNQEEHETYLDVNPMTGLPIRACRRGQVNIILNRILGFPRTKLIKETIFPIMYINETATIDDASAAQMRMLLLIVKLASNSPVLIVGLGGILLVVLVVLVYKDHQKKNEVKQIDFSEASQPFTTEKNDTDISGKAEEASELQPMKNGTYIAMTPVEVRKC